MKAYVFLTCTFKSGQTRDYMYETDDSVEEVCKRTTELWHKLPYLHGKDARSNSYFCICCTDVSTLTAEKVVR